MSRGFPGVRRALERLSQRERHGYLLSTLVADEEVAEIAEVENIHM